MIRPTWASVSSENAAYTSAILEKSFFSLADSWDEGRTASSSLYVPFVIGLICVRRAASGRTFFSIILPSAHLRYAS